jgi:hypothetical protein
MARKCSNLNLPVVAKSLKLEGPPSLPANFRSSFLGFHTASTARSSVVAGLTLTFKKGRQRCSCLLTAANTVGDARAAVSVAGQFESRELN